jgi:hypothetical protein
MFKNREILFYYNTMNSDNIKVTRFICLRYVPLNKKQTNRMGLSGYISG